MHRAHALKIPDFFSIEPFRFNKRFILMREKNSMRLRIFTSCIFIATAAVFVACGGGTPELPTPNAAQARAQTMIAQGTPASFLGTKVARPERTNTSESDNPNPDPNSNPQETANPTRAARQTRLAQQNNQPTAKPKATKPPSKKPTAVPDDFEPTATPPPFPRKRAPNSTRPNTRFRFLAGIAPKSPTAT